MPLILSGNVATALGGVYEVANSCMFNDGDNPKMVVTPSSSGTNAGKKYTLSAWVKLGNISVDKTIWSCSTDTYIYISGAGVITCNFRRDGGTNYEYGSTRKLKDPSAWYHIVLRVDTTDSTDADKVQVYVNGTEDTPTTTTYQNMADDYETGANVSGVEQRIGVYSDGSLDFDGYMAEVIMVDNQSLAPTEFGEYDEDTPTVWKPKDISGISVGTNGYYLDFEDSSNLGNNAAGSGSADLTETNLAATDQSTDTCTLNYPTFNPLDNTYGQGTFSEGNLKIVTSSSLYAVNTSTFHLTKGKWHFEVRVGDSNQKNCIGISGNSGTFSGDSTLAFGDSANEYSYTGTGELRHSGDSTGSWGSSFTDGDIIGCSFDLDNNEIFFYKNGTIQNSGSAFSITDPTSTSSGGYFVAGGDFASDNTSTMEYNFGSPTYSISSSAADSNGYGNFEHAPKSGHYAINSANLAEFG